MLLSLPGSACPAILVLGDAPLLAEHSPAALCHITLVHIMPADHMGARGLYYDSCQQRLVTGSLRAQAVWVSLYLTQHISQAAQCGPIGEWCQTVLQS